MFVDIVTPSKKILDSVQATSIVVPSKNGELEILDGHRTLVALLGTGIIQVKTDGVVKKIAVSQGSIEVRGQRVVILAETAEHGLEVDLDRAKKAQKKAETELENVISDEHFKKYQFKLRRSIARQSIV